MAWFRGRVFEVDGIVYAHPHVLQYAGWDSERGPGVIRPMFQLLPSSTEDWDEPADSTADNL